MFRWIFLTLLLVPAIELYFLIQVGSVIGALPTILLTIFTAVLGAYLMRSQGLMTLQQMQVQLAQGVRPEQTLIEGVMILLGGMLLLVPGLITDALGFALLIPPVRKKLAERMLSNMPRAPEGTVIIEGEVITREQTDSDPRLPPKP